MTLWAWLTVASVIDMPHMVVNADHETRMHLVVDKFLTLDLRKLLVDTPVCP